MISLTFALLAVCAIESLPAGELQKLTDCALIETAANDGDSFLVKADGERLHLRLYYVDCPELKDSKNYDLRRLCEQTRYFGLVDESRAIYFGKRAKRFTERQLQEPFTVYTAHAQAPGASRSRRVYAFVVTADGEYLDRLLVEKGLARAHGLGRGTPDGIGRDEMKDRLADMEAVAMLNRSGIWSETDPERMVELRQEMRAEERELKELEDRLEEDDKPQFPIDVNSATANQLQAINGIGPVYSKRIIENRPYEQLQDLYEIDNIRSNNIKRAIPFLRIEERQSGR